MGAVTFVWHHARLHERSLGGNIFTSLLRDDDSLMNSMQTPTDGTVPMLLYQSMDWGVGGTFFEEALDSSTFSCSS